MKNSKKNRISHVRRHDVRMVDVSSKPVTRRCAQAVACLQLQPKAFTHLIARGSPKGDVWHTARLAGIMAAKTTSQVIPLCHPILLENVSIDFRLKPKTNSVEVFSEVVGHGKTGVEMEALHAALTSVLTIYDMMKFLEQKIIIKNVKLLMKTGGIHGDYYAQ